MKITEIESKWIKENLTKIEFLNCLTPTQVIALLDTIEPQLIMGSQSIIKEGQTGQSFFLIYNGRVTVRIHRDGQSKKLAALRRGDYFGEISLLTGKPATADVTANAPSKVFFINSKLFIEMVRANKKLQERILNVMKKRIEERKQAIEDLKFGGLKDVHDAIKDFISVAGTPPSQPQTKKD